MNIRSLYIPVPRNGDDPVTHMAGNAEDIHRPAITAFLTPEAAVAWSDVNDGERVARFDIKGLLSFDCEPIIVHAQEEEEEA